MVTFSSLIGSERLLALIQTAITQMKSLGEIVELRGGESDEYKGSMTPIISNPAFKRTVHEQDDCISAKCIVTVT